MPDHNALLRAMRARATQWLVPISASVALSTSCFAQLPAWEAHHPQRPGRLIILGSIHLLRASDHPLPAVVDTIYSLADRLVFELDLDDLPGTAIQNSLMGAALLPADASLEDVIEPALFQETADAARTYGVDIRLFSRFEPWFVATMLLSFGLSQLGYEPQYGIEQHLLKMAQDDGKEVLGVEALDAQIAVFD
jgi:uncharacterized protein YbaP (TraB family)